MKIDGLYIIIFIFLFDKSLPFDKFFLENF
jgi:hypothetical protein